jgi:hypothetical protein
MGGRHTRITTDEMPSPFRNGRHGAIWRRNNIARIRDLLAVPLIPIDAIKAAKPKTGAQPKEPAAREQACPCCGGRMRTA